MHQVQTRDLSIATARAAELAAGLRPAELTRNDAAAIRGVVGADDRKPQAQSHVETWLISKTCFETLKTRTAATLPRLLVQAA